jgi:hypothetical protein
MQSLESRTLCAVHAEKDGSDLFITSGDASDRIEISQQGAGTLLVSGKGNTKVNKNNFDVFNNVRQVRIAMGAGNDKVTITNCFIEGFTRIAGGKGEDEIVISGGSIDRKLAIFGNSGPDLLQIVAGTYTRNVRIEGGKGNDNISTQSGVYNHDLRVLGQSGEDFIRIDALTSIGDELIAKGGSGDDTVFKPS